MSRKQLAVKSIKQLGAIKAMRLVQEWKNQSLISYHSCHSLTVKQLSQLIRKFGLENLLYFTTQSSKLWPRSPAYSFIAKGKLVILRWLAIEKLNVGDRLFDELYPLTVSVGPTFVNMINRNFKWLLEQFNNRSSQDLKLVSCLNEATVSLSSALNKITLALYCAIWICKTKLTLRTLEENKRKQRND